MATPYINRDISWLSFNERVLWEAVNKKVPLLERLKFLSIYSSNLDEFYRVRMPAIFALDKIGATGEDQRVLQQVKERINQQQQLFGKTLTSEILPELKENGINLVYNSPIPDVLKKELADYFFTQIASFLEPVYLSKATTFFPENNRIYLVADVEQNGNQELAIVNIPSVELGRFKTLFAEEQQFIMTLDDIIREHIHSVFQEGTINGVYSIKITRDAELELEDEYKGDIAEKIEAQIAKRDFGLATRLLYDGGMPEDVLDKLVAALKLNGAYNVSGGRYHNLKDLADFPVKKEKLSDDKWPSIQYRKAKQSLWEILGQKDIIIHPPYHSYDTVLRFFNEASLDEKVTEIYITLYRVAGDSRIAQALISAARNGKSVTVFVELKARFDEANNIRWAKKMKAAGVKIIYSIPGLKVHAKVALVKRRTDNKIAYYGLLATGNFNESTARFYTDHILFTANGAMLRELELLFLFLNKRRKPEPDDTFELEHLLVAQFNLRQKFVSLIDNEIQQAQEGKEALIRIKLNNLEEEKLISKLYEASAAGVKIELIIRGICRLKPGVPGLSENISVRRIVDRYLEHGRIFYFFNGGRERLYLGSADWMNRNIYRRIEVCFPVYDEAIKKELKELLNLQLTDNVKAVILNDSGENAAIVQDGEGGIQSQYEIYKKIKHSNEI